MKTFTTTPGRFYRFFPMSVTVISVRYKNKDNLMPAVWNSPLSFDPPLFGVSISPKRFTHELVKLAGEFTANFFDYAYSHKIAECGSVSGREIDKYEKFGLTKEDSQLVKSPIVKEAYCSLECILERVEAYGDHDWFVGKILGIHYEEDVYDEGGLLKLDTIRPAMYMGADTYFTADPKSKILIPRK
ncbi:MAG: flavin reductase family protein [Calditrichaeota bacterium]|nr:flavin reductase family protein [Calditrichota bacterium]